MQHITNSFSRYCTKDHSDLNAYGMDAYSVDWTRERCYINPPWTEIVRGTLVDIYAAKHNLHGLSGGAPSAIDQQSS